MFKTVAGCVQESIMGCVQESIAGCIQESDVFTRASNI